MKLIQLVLSTMVIVFAICESPVSKRPLIFSNWPPQSGKQQLMFGRNPQGKRTLMVQIRSDEHVPIVLKRGQHYYHQHQPQALMSRPMMRPHKMTPHLKLKGVHKPVRKPAGLLKVKLPSSKPAHHDKPYIYEKPSFLYPLLPEIQNLPLENNINLITEHFAPIHTIPAPNLGLHDNHIHHDDLAYFPPEPKPQPYHSNQYKVTEDHTNDQTILDPFSGQQKLFAPDPDPSLPTAKIRPATEPFNTPSNGKPLPVDVQTNYLPPAQPLVQIVGPQQQHLVPEIYPIHFTNQAQIQPYIVQQSAGIQTAPVSVYNPTYLVTQSNNLYTQHKQQLFKPQENVIAAGYVNADLTQEVASNGQILQAAKDPINNIHPVLDAAPQFAALIATPPQHQGHAVEFETAPFHLTNSGAQGGFVVSNFFATGNGRDEESQLLQAYAEEEAHRQQLANDQADLIFHEQQQQQQQQQQLELQEQQLLLQQQHNHQLELQQQQKAQQEQHHLLAQNGHAQPDPTTSAYEEHQRLLQQHLSESPLRIFVPDEDGLADGHQKLRKRSDNLKKGTVEDANSKERSFSVSSSVEVSSEDQKEE